MSQIRLERLNLINEKDAIDGNTLRSYYNEDFRSPSLNTIYSVNFPVQWHQLFFYFQNKFYYIERIAWRSSHTKIKGTRVDVVNGVREQKTRGVSTIFKQRYGSQYFKHFKKKCIIMMIIIWFYSRSAWTEKEAMINQTTKA